MISINGNVSGEQYRLLMEWAFANSDAAMFVVRNRGRIYWKAMRDIRKKLAPHRLATRSTPTIWPGTEVYSWQGHVERVHIDTYRLSNEMKDFIMQVGSLEGWICPDMPEDICFFLNGACWFSTTVHEGFFTIFGDDRRHSKVLRGFDIPHTCDSATCIPFIERYRLV